MIEAFKMLYFFLFLFFFMKV